ncbi:hypothetical protein J4573_04700 [Actinomadura barringtoniae]|uniref:Uncharacterized protein n=1 Tax=Actinomadura barringtoniae TaxID=1427535 RepID=A0A939T2C6_9ACTN|nr:hypothetical protein [Actinomadura barringtoniae]MBO2446378.1 hypothetical protein [Actinomadura barringtoniae]
MFEPDEHVVAYKAYRSFKNPSCWNGTWCSCTRGQAPLVLTVYTKKSRYPKVGMFIVAR